MEKGFFLYSGGSHQVSQMRVYKYIQELWKKKHSDLMHFFSEDPLLKILPALDIAGSSLHHWSDKT